MKTVILIAGHKRSGKDFVADYIVSRSAGSVKKYSFTYPLKRLVCSIFDITMDELDEYKNRPNTYNLTMENDILYDIDFRQILQRTGEHLKTFTYPEIHADKMLESIDKSDHNIFVIPDHRYETEERIMRKHFNVINVLVVGGESNDTHSSEQIPKFGSQPFVIDNTEKSSAVFDELDLLIQAINAHREPP